MEIYHNIAVLDFSLQIHGIFRMVWNKSDDIQKCLIDVGAKNPFEWYLPAYTAKVLLITDIPESLFVSHPLISLLDENFRFDVKNFLNKYGVPFFYESPGRRAKDKIICDNTFHLAAVDDNMAVLMEYPYRNNRDAAYYFRKGSFFHNEKPVYSLKSYVNSESLKNGQLTPDPDTLKEENKVLYYPDIYEKIPMPIYGKCVSEAESFLGKAWIVTDERTIPCDVTYLDNGKLKTAARIWLNPYYTFILFDNRASLHQYIFDKANLVSLSPGEFSFNMSEWFEAHGVKEEIRYFKTSPGTVTASEYGFSVEKSSWNSYAMTASFTGYQYYADLAICGEYLTALYYIEHTVDYYSNDTLKLAYRALHSATKNILERCGRDILPEDIADTLSALEKNDHFVIITNRGRYIVHSWNIDKDGNLYKGIYRKDQKQVTEFEVNKFGKIYTFSLDDSTWEKRAEIIGRLISVRSKKKMEEFSL